MISKSTLNRLIQLGRRKDIDKPGTAKRFSDLRDAEEINRLTSMEWEDATEHLSTTEILSLLKGLTIAEQRFRWTGGSVAAAIWVYNILRDRDLALAKEAGEWVARRSSNPWVPYTTPRGAVIPHEMQATLDGLDPVEREKWYQEFVRSWEKYYVWREEQKRIRKERNLAIERGKQEAREKKRQKRLGRPPAPFKNVDEWRRIIENAGKGIPQARLETIVSHPEIPLNYFPKEWGEVNDELLKSLEEETRELLLKRLKGRRGEPWRRIFHFLGGM